MPVDDTVRTQDFRAWVLIAESFQSASCGSCRQRNFPLPLPNAFLGLFPKAELGVSFQAASVERRNRDRVAVSPPLFWHNYTYSEAAFYHKDTESILVTDAAVYVGETARESSRRTI